MQYSAETLAYGKRKTAEMRTKGVAGNLLTIAFSIMVAAVVVVDVTNADLQSIGQTMTGKFFKKK